MRDMALTDDNERLTHRRVIEYTQLMTLHEKQGRAVLVEYSI